MAAIARYAADATRPDWWAQCDTCGDNGPRADHLDDAIVAAAAEGWYAAPNAAAQCPRHVLGSPATGRPVAEGQQHADGTTVIRVVPDLRPTSLRS